MRCVRIRRRCLGAQGRGAHAGDQAGSFANGETCGAGSMQTPRRAAVAVSTRGPVHASFGACRVAADAIA